MATRSNPRTRLATIAAATRIGLAAVGAIVLALVAVGCEGEDRAPRDSSRRMAETRALAEELERDGELDDALAAFRDASRRHPTEMWPWAGLGRTSAALGRFRDAEQAFRTAVRWDSTRAEPRAALAELLREDGRAEEALDWIESAIRLGGHDTRRGGLRARVLADLGRHGEARTTLDRAIVSAPDDVALRVTSLLCRLAGGEDSRALVELDAVTRTHGDDPRVELARAEVLRTFGDPEGAMESLRHALAMDPVQPRARQKLASLLLAGQQIPEAMEEFRTLLEQDPRSAFALEGLGRCARATGDAASAEEAFRHAIQADPEYAPAHLALGRLLVDAGRAAESITFLRKARTRALDGELWEQSSVVLGDTYLALGEAAHALEIADAMLLRREDSAPALSLRGRALAAGGAGVTSGAELERFARRPGAGRDEIVAFADWLLRHGSAEQALAVTDELLVGHAPDTESGLLRARALTGAGRRDEAEIVLHELLEREPESADVCLALSHLYQADGRLPDAVFHAAAGERLRPDDPAFPALRGLVALEEGRLDDARAAFERECAIDSTRSEAWTHLGEAEMRAGRPAEAARQFARAEELAPTDWKPAYLRALAETEAGRPEIAIEAYGTVLARDERIAEAHNNLAWLLADLDLDPVLAEVHARRAAELAPDNADVLGTLGWTQYKNGQVEDAAATLLAAVQAKPDDAMKHYLLGVVQAQAGRADDARRSLTTALEQPETFPRADRARELLERLEP